MRLLQLQVADATIDLHPMVTVVQGLGPAGRERMVEVFTAVSRAGSVACHGLVEAHGMLFDLTSQNLALLGFEGVDVDVLVRAGDLPGVPLAPAVAERPDDGALADVLPLDRGARSGAAAPVTAETVLDHVPEGRFPELDAARRDAESAQEAHDVLTEATDRARSGLADAQVARAALEDELEASLRVLEAARAGVRRVEDASVIDARRREHDDARAKVSERVEAARARKTQAERGLSELAAIDVRPIEVLLEAIRNPAPTVMMPSERANELADEIVGLRRRMAEAERRLEAEGFSMAQAERLLEEAKADLVEAERGAQKPTLGPDDIAALEEAHERVLEAESRAGGRIGGKASKRRLEEALAEQQRILDRVGFPTWSAYVMGATLLGIDPVAEQRVDQARAALEQAEANWRVITEALEHDPEHRELLDRLESVYLEAFDLLGGDTNIEDDLETALRHLEVPVQEVTQDDLVAAMAYQFELLGLDLGASASLEMVTMAAEALLSEAEAIGVRIRELQGERAAADAELRLAEADLGDLGHFDDQPVLEVVEVSAEAVGGAEDAFDELTERLLDAREEEKDHAELVEAREALADTAAHTLAVCRRKLEAVAAEIAEAYADELADELAAVLPFDAGEPAATAPSGSLLDQLDDSPTATLGGEGDDDSVVGAEFYLLARLAAQRNVSFAGSLPMLVDEPFGALAAESKALLLDRLANMGGSVQVVVLSDDHDVVHWAERVGLEQAAALRAPAAFA